MSSREISALAGPHARPGFTSSCFSLLQELQNSDGGWGFHRGANSTVEATCWAARALSSSDSEPHVTAVAQAYEYLQRTQHGDGSWPAAAEMSTGSWITSLACSILSRERKATTAVQRGLHWLCDDFPRDSSPFQRFIRSLRPAARLSEQSDAYRGWGWTPRTSSWVEPTSFALMAFAECDAALLPPTASRRRESAIAMLYDRMCPGGGWNCGNPRVYGVDGEALVLPTCWALLALRGQPESAQRTKSLAWLQKEFPKIQSAASHSIASITMSAYRISPHPAKFDPASRTAAELAEQGIHALAWSCLESDSSRIWPQDAPSFGGRSNRSESNQLGERQ